MAKSLQISLTTLLFMLVLSASCVNLSHGSKKPVGVARKEDIPYIKCQVCEKLAKELYSQVQAKEANVSPKKISEYEIIEISENICNLKKHEADWILKIDILEQGDRLELVEQDSEGQCNSKCKTIERACQEIMGYSDTDVAEYLYKKKPQMESLVSFLCKDLTGACSKKPPPVPKDRVPGEPFVPKSAKEAEMEKLLKSMEGLPGAPGMKMYSREDLMKQNFGDEDAEDDDGDEEDEDEDRFPSKLGKVLREKQSEKVNWKQRITRGLLGAGETVKSTVNEASQRIQQWWRSTTSPKKNSKSKSEL